MKAVRLKYWKCNCTKYSNKPNERNPVYRRVGQSATRFSQHQVILLPPPIIMPPRTCALCSKNRAMLKRPKTGQQICRECFFYVFETEVHNTIIQAALFKRGEKVAIGASGGKDSTVLAYVMKELNERYDYGLDLFLLSIDEGITGYRDDSLEVRFLTLAGRGYQVKESS